MTNKSLSEQICEVCGIEPLYHFYDESVDPILDEYLTKQEILEQYVSEQTPFEDYKKFEVYPDFKNNNNNFVKLWELKIINNITLAQLFIIWNVMGGSKDYFLHNLTTIIRKDINIEENTVELIKQKIRQAIWEY